MLLRFTLEMLLRKSLIFTVSKRNLTICNQTPKLSYFLFFLFVAMCLLCWCQRMCSLVDGFFWWINLLSIQNLLHDEFISSNTKLNPSDLTMLTWIWYCQVCALDRGRWLPIQSYPLTFFIVNKLNITTTCSYSLSIKVMN